MAAFRDDMPLIAGVNEDWDENTTGTQIMRPDWDFSPNSIRMRTMHHLPQISSIRCARKGLIVLYWFLVVSQWRATKLSPRTYTVTSHVVYQQEISCQPKKRRYA